MEEKNNVEGNDPDRANPGETNSGKTISGDDKILEGEKINGGKVARNKSMDEKEKKSGDEKASQKALGEDLEEGSPDFEENGGCEKKSDCSDDADSGSNAGSSENEVSGSDCKDMKSEGSKFDESEKEKSSFFKKKKDKKDEKIDELKDRLMRNMAEFENFRKRSEKEKSQMFEIGAKSIIEKILPVVDNFERGLDSISEEERKGSFAQGVEQIYKQLINTLKEAGVTPIEAEGKEFDPNLHNAVMHGEDESLGENIVSEELQKGYMYKDTVVRHSMVKVVN